MGLAVGLAVGPAVTRQASTFSLLNFDATLILLRPVKVKYLQCKSYMFAGCDADL